MNHMRRMIDPFLTPEELNRLSQLEMEYDEADCGDHDLFDSRAEKINQEALEIVNRGRERFRASMLETLERMNH